MNQLQKFQKKNGLLDDGIIGKKTLSKFKEVFCLTNEQTAHFVGQIAHETGDFRYEEENLNYSADALRRVFGKYFPYREMAEKYARKPEAIANVVYGNRMGNNEPGDGWKYRGRGAIQLTGKNNYERFASKIKDLQILCNPDLVIKKYFFDSAIFFFNDNHLWQYCEEVNNESIIALTKRINGGTNGLQDRIEKAKKYYGILTKM